MRLLFLGKSEATSIVFVSAFVTPTVAPARYTETDR
jgi:hypothetical protein